MTQRQRNAFEVATWPCSEEYVKSPSIVRPAFELLVGSEGRWGLSEIFYGVEVGKPNAYGVLNWVSMAAHEKFVSDQETLLKFFELFESSAEGGAPKGAIIHAAWEEDAAVPCLEAPFVELKKISPKQGVTIEVIDKALDKYVAYMKDSSSGVVGATYGPVIEEEEQFVMVVGWKSIEVATKDGVGDPRGQEILREMSEIAEEVVISLSLTQF